MSPAVLTEMALHRGEGELSNTGALVVKTANYTGCSPKDKFIVATPTIHDTTSWGKVNMPISRDRFNAIKAKMTTYLQNKEIFVFDGLAGTDPTKTKKIDGVYSEAAIMTDYEAKMVLIAGFQYSGEIKKVIFSVMNLLLPLKGIGTERHIRKPVPTCSTLFGEPFIPMDPNIYVKMLGDKLDKYNPQVYLVITGWTGGPLMEQASV